MKWWYIEYTQEYEESGSDHEISDDEEDSNSIYDPYDQLKLYIVVPSYLAFYLRKN